MNHISMIIINIMSIEIYKVLFYVNILHIKSI